MEGQRLRKRGKAPGQEKIIAERKKNNNFEKTEANTQFRIFKKQVRFKRYFESLFSVNNYLYAALKIAFKRFCHLLNVLFAVQ